MPDNLMDQIAGEIRSSSAEWYPERGEARAVRIVGHTPKTDHYIYDLVVDFANGRNVWRRSSTARARAGRRARAIGSGGKRASALDLEHREGEESRRNTEADGRLQRDWARW